MALIQLILLVLACGMLAPPARAQDEVAFLSSESRAAEHTASLALALRGYGVAVRSLPGAEGDSPLGRAAAAQRALRENGLRAVLWLEPEPPTRVRALPASSDGLVEAPLPGPFAQLDPEVFASVATSVVLEAMGRTTVAPYVPTRVTYPVSWPPASAPPPRLESSEHMEAQDELPRRFFLRVAGSLGLASLRSGQDLETSPPSGLAQEAVNASQGLTGTEQERASAAVLKQNGYDCDARTLADGRMAFNDCKSVVGTPGFNFVPAFDLALGLNVVPRVALTLAGRVGRLDSGVLLGMQAEVLLSRPRDVGAWVSLVGGFGGGRIKVAAPPAGSSNYAPKIVGGILDVRTGLLAGYRFHPNVGLTLGLAVHYMFPSPLVLVDPTLGLEVRM